MRRALAFLTPLGGAAPPAPSALVWFPAVGAGLGLALGGVWWLAGEIWPAVVAAAVVVAADLALTGMLHLDGLIDSADGLLPPLERSRRLEVMSDPHAGAFGVGAAVVVLLARWSALGALRPSGLLLAGLWCASRTTMAGVVRAVPYARPGGLAGAFRAAKSPPVWLMAGGLVASVAMAALAAGAQGAVSVAIGVLAALGVVAFARRRIGGFTGDVLGAAGLVGETAGLLAASARW
jgi:adenosylcobinamide-GDP ribazoletransferase